MNSTVADNHSVTFHECGIYIDSCSKTKLQLFK